MSLSVSRERIETTARDLGRAVMYAKQSKVTISIHAPGCYKIASWRGWHYLYWPGTATLMGFGIQEKFSELTRCSLMKLIQEICAISQGERLEDIGTFTRTKTNEHGEHLEEVNQEPPKRFGGGRHLAKRDKSLRGGLSGKKPGRDLK